MPLAACQNAELLLFDHHRIYLDVLSAFRVTYLMFQVDAGKWVARLLGMWNKTPTPYYEVKAQGKFIF